MSTVFFDQLKKNHSFQVSGPYGKGLGITSQSKGVHFVFAAGVGVLPFMDLISKMIL